MCSVCIYGHTVTWKKTVAEELPYSPLHMKLKVNNYFCYLKINTASLWVEKLTQKVCVNVIGLKRFPGLQYVCSYTCMYVV